ncbi:hypothetical protein A8709_24720 [Paenibacillus pectinilyticus]|uniref:DUF3679 domain-containing protein n=1 Tax=Paenibacillus pectinilyticus TaxID=512399 RepID=A0A1C1A9A0_9BACL|nr:DUF3679 domain-containing protein [Paenibacillus pectinilyticus]OCT17184.1 hypothetical protein A8709_24720 [Paenibacillus pectinilyticus]
MKLRHFYIKVSLFGLLLLFCILFGVSLASSGMERIEGPQPSSKAIAQEAAVKTTGKTVTTAVTVTPSPTAAVKDGINKSKQTAEQQVVPIADHDNSLNHVGNKLGEVLQITAHYGIKLFVSLFDAVLGKG